MKVRSVKHMMVAAALTVSTAIAGMVGQAQAFSFGQNDLVLAIYGNNTEALYNLGDFNTRLGSGATFSLDVSAGISAASVGANPVKWTVFGWDVTLPAGQVHAATTFAPGQVQPPGTLLDLTSQLNPALAWSSNSDFTGDTIAKADIKSFSSNLNQDGSGKLGGAWPVAMQGELGQFMNILRGDVENNTFSAVGRVLLAANGLLTIGNPGPNPVPLPAGVVLFGSGLIGLIGVARRSFTRKAA
jgi:hypothetical protein